VTVVNDDIGFFAMQLGLASFDPLTQNKIGYKRPLSCKKLASNKLYEIIKGITLQRR
jgi:hypothetical protein